MHKKVANTRILMWESWLFILCLVSTNTTKSRRLINITCYSSDALKRCAQCVDGDRMVALRTVGWWQLTMSVLSFKVINLFPFIISVVYSLSDLQESPSAPSFASRSPIQNLLWLLCLLMHERCCHLFNFLVQGYLLFCFVRQQLFSHPPTLALFTQST